MLGRLSYAAQEPFVVHGSVRHNVVFGEPFDLDRYSRVVKACGLEPDLDSFERGDKTVVGDRGTRVSGGQKVMLRYLHTVLPYASF